MAELNEVVAEAAEKVAEEATEVAEVSRRFSGRDVSLVLAGMVGGFVIGGLVANLVIAKRYDALAQEEVNMMREHFQAKKAAMDNEEKKPALEDLNKVVKDAGYAEPDPQGAPNTILKAPMAEDSGMVQAAREVTEITMDQVPPELKEKILREAQAMRPDEGPVAEMPGIKDAVVERNVFREHDREGWNWSEELESRSEEEPYVIHVDEQGEKGYHANVLTFYEGDGVLADDQDHVIEDPLKVVGEFEEKWGHGSGDPNIVYVRNEQISSEYEIIRDSGSYAQVVHGQNDEDELPQAYHRKFTDDDD